MKVLVADDHPMFVEGLVSLLRALGEDVIAAASNGAEAVRLSVELRPDLVLMDLTMPVLDGISAIRQLGEAAPSIAVLVLTMRDDEQSIQAALAAGARGYLLKEATSDDITRALRAVSAGDSIMSTQVASRLGGSLRRSASVREPRVHGWEPLTPREDHVLRLVADGYSNPAIAERLYLSEKTVRNYVSLIFTKLQVTTRAEVIVAARNRGYGTEPRQPPG